MPFFHCYRPHRFTSAAQETVDQANVIINELQAEGHTLTLRQIYYQLVARGLMPNEDKEYKRLGRLITRARESGITDWLAIEDRGRSAYSTHTEEDPEEVLYGIENGLVFDQWERQDHYIEVWVEKAALEGVIARPCNRLDITYMACRGYLSASEAWRAGLRFAKAIRNGKEPILIHLADHDPSGLNMTDDNRDRVRLFAENNHIQVRRIALNMDQVHQYNPPPNPAKETDSRAPAYVEKYGHSSWELDALNPSVLDDLITSTIDEYRNVDIWDKTLDKQKEARKPLEALGENWSEVQDFLEREGLL
jgi:hypothetical protein